MTGPIERRLEALERDRAASERDPRGMTAAELERVLIESLGYLPCGDELKLLANEKRADDDAT